MLHLTLSTPDKCAKQEVRFRLRTFLWLDSLLFLYRDGVSPDSGAVHLNGGAV